MAAAFLEALRQLLYLIRALCLCPGEVLGACDCSTIEAQGGHSGILISL